MTTHYQLKTHEFTTDIFMKQFEIEILHYQGKLFTNLRLCYLSFIQLSNFKLTFSQIKLQHCSSVKIVSFTKHGSL